MDKKDCNEETGVTSPELGERLVRVPLDALQDAAVDKDEKT